MRALSLRLLTILGLTTCLLACDRETEELQLEPATDYVRLEPGKYITYRLDSTVFTNLGRSKEVHSYQEKHLIDAQITDNLGRPSYRVFRFIRDVAGTQSWAPSGTYMITPLEHSLEVIEDNMRVVKLVTPIKESTTWHGNQYLASDAYGSKYGFSNDDKMAFWEFAITTVGESVTLGGQALNDVITMVGQDEASSDPTTTPDMYASRDLLEEKYAKGLGLVFQEFIMWEYQPSPGPGIPPYYTGFGVKRSLIDHN